jgi:ribosomal protein L16 Arg81 hydroxylase
MTSETKAKTFDLAELLAPARPENFFSTHWERKPLHVSRSNPHYYDSILTNGDLERIISSNDLRYPAIQLSKNGSYLASEVYTKNIRHGSEFFNGVPDLRQIQSEYRSGATVVLPALQWTWPPLRQLCAALEEELSHPTHANAYLTPGASPGFTPHYDTHEVLVLQIAGKKQWRVFEPPLSLPHRTQPFTPVGYALPAPILELELRQGDLLYLPRGYVHAATALGGHSAHITIGITVYTWVELVSELVGSSKEMAAFRGALPPGFANREEHKQTLRDGLVRCFAQLRDRSASEHLVEGFLQKVKSTRVHPETRFQADVRVVGLQTLLNAPPADRYRIAIESRSAVLEFEGRKFAIPDQFRSVVEEMCKRRSFRAADLSGPLDSDAKLNVARYLHTERFLTVAD